MVSGLWQYKQEKLHPCRKMAVRFPGPSTELNWMILLTSASKSAYPSIQRFAVCGSAQTQAGSVLAHILPGSKLFHLGTLDQITGHPNHVAVAAVERQIADIQL